MSGSARGPAALEFSSCSGAVSGSDGYSGCAEPRCWRDGDPAALQTRPPHTPLLAVFEVLAARRASAARPLSPDSAPRHPPPAGLPLIPGRGSAPLPAPAHPREAAELSRCPPAAAAGRGRAEEPPLRGRGAIRAARRGAGRSGSHGEPCHPRGLRVGLHGAAPHAAQEGDLGYDGELGGGRGRSGSRAGLRSWTGRDGRGGGSAPGPPVSVRLGVVSRLRRARAAARWAVGYFPRGA